MADYKFTNNQLMIEELLHAPITVECNEKLINVRSAIVQLLQDEQRPSQKTLLQGTLKLIDERLKQTDKPRPLKSNWMMRWRQTPPTRPTTTKYFIDDLKTGETICEAVDLTAAHEFVASYSGRCQIREEVFDELRLQSEDRERKERISISKGY